MPEADFQTGQQPSLTDFLPDTMSAITTSPTLPGTTTTTNNNTNAPSSSCKTLPSFAECIVLASLCSHSVAHRRLAQSSTFANCTPDSQVFWLTRHQWLAAATRARIEEHTTRLAASSIPAPPPDPLCTFARVLACGAAVSINDAAEANPWQTLEDSMAQRQFTYQITTELVLHLQNVPRLAFPKVC